MRKNLKRKIALTAMSCLAFACVSVGGVSLASALEPQDPVFSMENGGAFYMIEGASVRLYDGENLGGIDGNAMRFMFEMSEEQYGELIENGEYKPNVSVTSYVIAEDKIDDGLTTAKEIAEYDSDVVPTTIPVKKWKKGTSEVKGSSATVYYACAYVYNVPKEYYDDNVSAFAVLTTETGSMYTSVQSRSMSYVADAALTSNAYPSDKTKLESYLTDKFVWVKNANEPIVVTDFTTGPYVKTTQDFSSFYFAYSAWNYKAPEIIQNGEVGGVVGTYAKIGFSSNQNTNYTSMLNFSLMNTTSLETLQAYADMGYTLKLPVYLATNGTNAGETSTVYTLEYDRSGETPTLKTITESSRTTTIQTDDWQEVELNIDDYILMMQTLADSAKTTGIDYYYAKVTNDSAILNMQIRYGTSENPSWTAYFGEMYLEAPTTTVATVNGMTVNFESYIPEAEGEYEYYKVENGVYTELKATSIVAGKNDFKIAIVKVADTARTVMNFVDVRVETADEWLASVNESISGTKIVTDFTGDVYYDIKSGNTVTYFAKENGKMFGNKVTISNTAPNKEEGSYAKFSSATYGDSTACLMLYNTMSLDMLRLYADMGYTMKLSIYIDTTNSTDTKSANNRTARTVMCGADGALVSVASSSNTNTYTIVPNTWTSVEVSIYDYIYLVETVGRPYTQRTNKQAMIGVKLYKAETVYMSEMYLEAPKGAITETVTQGETLTVSDYKPAEEAFYEYYKFENGVYTAIEEGTVTVGETNFQIAVVKVAIVDGNVERTFVNRVDVTAQAESAT